MSYYRIPAGTALPFGLTIVLTIVRDEHNPKCDATHYTIAPAFDMPLARFKSLLNELAANAVKEAI